MKKPSMMWSVSLLAIAIVTLIITFSSIFGVDLPNGLKIILGVTDLAALPILIYTSIKFMKSDN